jgi:hypothetical protein
LIRIILFFLFFDYKITGKRAENAGYRRQPAIAGSRLLF